MKKPVLIVLAAAILTSLSCRSGMETQAQSKSGNADSVRSENSNKLTDKDETTQRNEKTMNIKESLKFNDAKPAILSIINSEKVSLKAVGLEKGQVLAKHKSGLKSLVVILEGKIEFTINDEKFELNALDTYEIPVNVEHEIRGIEKSIFTLTQEK